MASELERLEAELKSLQSKLADSTHRERSKSEQLSAQSAALEVLKTRIDGLRREVPPDAPPAGTLTGIGHWEPLPLGPNENASSEPALELKPEADLAAISKFLERFVLQPDAENDFRLLLTLTDRYRHQPELRRLLAGTYFSIGKLDQAQGLDPSIERETDFKPAERVHIPWLTGALEIPSEGDGVTDRQRRLIEVIERIAPANRPAIRIELIEREVPFEPALVHSALLALAHPALRPLPIIELFGTDGPLSNHDSRIERVRMGRWPDWRTLPLALINGFTANARSCPPREPHAVIASLLDQLNDTTDEWWVREMPAFPNCRSEVRNANQLHDGKANVVMRAKMVADASPRIVITEIPWPLRVGELKAEIESLRLDGVLSIDDGSNARHTRLVLSLEHVAFGNLTMARLRRHANLGVEWVFENEWLGRRALTFSQFSEAWLEERLNRMSDEGTDATPLEARAAEFEALFLARSMLEPIQALFREALDDREAIDLLVRFFETHDRAPLETLIRRSHRYERGFSEAQAKYLVKVKKLHSHNLEHIRSDWSHALVRLDELRAATRGREELKTALREQLLRFDQRVRSLSS